MNPFLRIRKASLAIFFSGLTFGVLLVSILPEAGRVNFLFQLGQVGWLRTAQAGLSGNLILVLMISVRNYAIALLMAVTPIILIAYTLNYRKRRPFGSGDNLQRIVREIKLELTIYPASVLFAYGFVVFGLFLAYVFSMRSLYGLTRWCFYLVPHGIAETAGIILAASTSYVIKDSWLRNPGLSFSAFCQKMPRRSYVNYLVFLMLVFVSSAFLEVFVSRGFTAFLCKLIGI